jgi:type II secretory pathway pseudopilin PulG
MKIYRTIQASDAKEMSRQGELAFTMIEIAIAIGVIGFALVAIIGILPAGMDVQKDNREDTLVSQDAPYFLDAIRNGTFLSNNLPGGTARGLDFLTNYVQSIRYDTIVNGVTNTTLTTNFNSFGAGFIIIGLLSAPQYNYGLPGFASNYFDVTAIVRALSGPATEQQTGANTGVSSATAFTYQMEVMVTPFNSFAPFPTNWYAYAQQPGADPNLVIIMSNRWIEITPGLSYPPNYISPENFAPGTGGLVYNLFDVRLRFSWPVLANGKVGPGRQTYRTLVASQLQRSGFTFDSAPLWFFQPQTYINTNLAGVGL